MRDFSIDASAGNVIMTPLPIFNHRQLRKLMQGSLGHIIWTVCYLSVLAGLSAYGIHRYFIIYLYLKNRKHPPVPAGRFEQLPKVTVQLPIFNEVYVAERLLRSVSELNYPQHLLQIQVLDDSTDDTREIVTACADQLRQRGFNVQCIHRVDRTGFKAGALAAGLEAAEGEFLCILDADFVPKPDLLNRTIHFFTDPKIGMIQTRWGHLNRGYSLLTRMQAIFLDGHLLLEQTARSRSGRFFNFNGTAGLWRRSCIEQSGGWQHDTLCEDLDLSYRAQLALRLSRRSRHASGVAGGYERFQIPTASLDKRLYPDVQEIAAYDMAEPASVSDQIGGHWSFDVQLRLPAACLFMPPFASLRRRAPRRVAADPVHRCPDLLRRVGLGRGVLCLRTARTASAHMVESSFVFAVLTRPRHWAFTQQRARGAGSALQSPIRFHAHAQVWNRAQIAAMANLQISAGETDVAIGGAGICDLFHLFCLVRDWAWPVPLGTFPSHVPRRISLCLSLFISQSLAKNQSW